MFGNEAALKYLLEEEVYIDTDLVEQEVLHFNPEDVLKYLKEAEDDIFYDEDVEDMVEKYSGET